MTPTETVTPEREAPAGGGGLREIDAATLRGWLDRGECVLVDVREPGEHARRRIPEASLAPLSRIGSEGVPDTGEGRLVLHCNTGNRSERAARKLLADGHAEVWHLAGGIEAWRAAGQPVEVDEDAPIELQRQVQIAAGSLVLAGTLAGALFSPLWLALAGFVGAGLVFAGVTGTCGMARLLSLLPYNRR